VIILLSVTADDEGGGWNAATYQVWDCMSSYTIGVGDLVGGDT